MQPPEKKRGGYQMSLVIRRVGGLEETHREISGVFQVIRRVGGLEELPGCPGGSAPVIRRVGGLEDQL